MHGTQHKGEFKKLDRPWSGDDLELWDRACRAKARENFYAYRKMIRPDMKMGWWQRLVAKELQQFYIRWQNGECPILVLEAPPQHGKSSQVTDFIGWCSGKNPNFKTIYTSYSDNLGLAANLLLQRTIEGEAFPKIFDRTKLAEARSHASERRTDNYLEFVGAKGSFRNTTVRGQITGMGLDLGVIDDPIKGREEASSEVIRDKVWNWLTDDFLTRLSEEAAILMIQTRWHLDDPVGRFLAKNVQARVLKFPALGQWVNDKWVAADEKALDEAEPLFPELKSHRFLMARRNERTISSWSSLYQQNPIVAGGDQFPIEKFGMLDVMPNETLIRRSVRYWDKAGTQGGGAFTAGVLMHELTDKRIVIENVIRGQWSALTREQRIKQTADLDNQDRIVKTYVEQEPGSGGKESAESTIMNLRGHRVAADKVTGKKEIRCEPYAAQVQAGNVNLIKGPWNKPFLDEHEEWPNGKYKDQVDAAGGAFLKMTVTGTTYDTSMSWVGDEAEDPNDD